MASPFLPDCLKHRVALVTGGATGIGLGICTQLVRHGAKVAIMGRRLEVGQDAVAKLQAEGGEAMFVQGDVRYPEQCVAVVNAVIKRWGGLNMLVNNAAGNFVVAAEDLTPKGLATVLGIDLQGCFHMCKAALEPLKQARDSIIINTTATLQYKATPFQFHASAAKAGIDVLTNTIGVEWGRYGIRTVGIAPGPIVGTVGGPGGRVFGDGILETSNDAEEIRNVVPVGRYGTVTDIALTAVFLATPAGGFINGTTVVVDGGQWHGSSMMYEAARDVIREKSETERTQFKGGVRKAKL
eukprot:CAMPEP_0175918056 /NCGR_PEP_ID=MMETSP0108-20121206/11682_1 /TAXON_ID=195067 ORGANISM="Goniomonas pacifica, Strain CCMP1869" /NCGR_SAMPLE_ID=MMETSP0108 /ASSEMBLY_ACC=CAM_ASM_000204 /LENGTH=296 /DNA_ID=CAMNT_0017240661 /DNA_START=1 /DNA_END=891 /DNA_ORIENTATION=+